jgi:hypothetical protein
MQSLIQCDTLWTRLRLVTMATGAPVVIEDGVVARAMA